MVWPVGSLTFALLAIALLRPSWVRSAPHAPDGQEQSPHQEKKAHSPQQDPSGGLSAKPLGQAETARLYQARSAPDQPRPDTGFDGDLFRGVDAKALAAVLLQALKADGEKPRTDEAKRRGALDSPSAYLPPPGKVPAGSEEEEGENVRSVTREKARDPDRPRDGEGDGDGQGPRTLESMFRDLERYSAATKRERSNAVEGSKQGDISRELDAFEEMLDRKRGGGQEEDGGRGRMGLGGQGREETGDKASELLLQYLLGGPEGSEEEEDDGGKGEGGSETGQGGDSASEEKRSDEEEEEGEDMDPQTIDRLIEISSKLHLPADDVIDIINDVEKKRRDSVERGGVRRGGGGGVPRRKFRPSGPAPRYEQPRHRPPTDLALQDLLSAENALDYGGFGGANAPPRRYRPGQNPYPNYIRPRAYPQRHRPYYYQPVFRSEDYYDDESQDKEEELENYIEKILLKHPEVFQ